MFLSLAVGAILAMAWLLRIPAERGPWLQRPREYPRLGFVLLNREIRQVVLPLREAAPFPSQGVDALVFGCEQADHFRAVLLAVPQEGLLLQSDLPEWSCP